MTAPVLDSIEATGKANLSRGVYRHYKGGHYLVVGTAWHSETHELMVVYTPLYETGMPTDFVVRPYRLFTDEVSSGVRRFRYLGANAP